MLLKLVQNEQKEQRNRAVVFTFLQRVENQPEHTAGKTLSCWYNTENVGVATKMQVGWIYIG